MPLPRSEREIEVLTEGWPGEPDGFELAAFAATFRADRPELSPPALDRIGWQLQGELARLDRSAARAMALRATVLRFRRFAPLTAAAVVALAVGAWIRIGTGSRSEDGAVPGRSVPVIHSQPVPTDGAIPPRSSKPIVN